MRSEVEVRELFKQYCYRYAIASIDNQEQKKDQFFGASLALGRTLGKTNNTISKDITRSVEFIERLRKEGKDLPGFKEV